LIRHGFFLFLHAEVVKVMEMAQICFGQPREESFSRLLNSAEFLDAGQQGPPQLSLG